MRLLLDEMLSPVVAEQLRARGHDVEAIAARPQAVGLGDADVLALARRERRALVTNNVADFRRLHAEAVVPGGPGHYGIVFTPSTFGRPRAATGRIVGALEAVLAACPGERDVADGETWL